MKGKQKAYLRGLAHSMQPILQVGKGGVTENLVCQLQEALEARELVKVNVLKNSPAESRELAEELGKKTGAEVIQVIGNKITLYKQSKKKPEIVLPE